MCANYTPVTQREIVQLHFDAGTPFEPVGVEAWPLSVAPFVRNVAYPGRGREALLGRFGLIPHWAKSADFGKMTYNARLETVAQKPSFRDAWRLNRRCIIPALSFFEPNYESGKAVRWQIARADREPLGLAGLWSSWKGPDGQPWLSFTMLTVNADHDCFMRQFHKPEDEKRSVVVLDPAQYATWLQAPIPEAEVLLKPAPEGLLEAWPQPLQRKPR